MKELAKTPFLTALLTSVVGPDVDLAKLHVYEVRATSTVALRGKRDTVFEKAKISPNTISQLAQAVTKEPVALMMDHDMRGTPYGKFFYGEAVPMDNGETELRGYMYVDDSEQAIITKLDTASIEEVSIQFSSEKMLCSECGFDYRAAAAVDNYMPFMLKACDEGHVIGKDGVHLNLVGVDEVIELSMVSRGAAKNSKIITPSDAMLGQSAQRLAAKGVDVLQNFYCTATLSSDQGEDQVDFEKFMAKLDAANGEKTELTVALGTANTKVTALEASAVTDAARIAELEGQVATLEASAADAEVKPETLTALKAHIGKQFIALKALDGDAAATALDDTDAMVTFINENEARLSALIPVGGVTTAAGAEIDEAAKAKEDRLRATANAYKN